ncbi:hypothetical protein [Oleiharenicola sp. Vm1]|uniref:hypothetical protein n=1 Tax=Oleiharenicola sp. Vm1 TaxID=3398393 RepID=UPI0039F4CF33
MAMPYPNLRHAQYASALGVVGPRRDVRWGKFLFSPPELVNPNAIFDPQPFRTQPPAPAPKRARG